MLRITSYKPYKFCTSLHYISLIDEFSGVKTAWSESSAACPRPWGGHRNGEKLEAGAFATLERRGPQGRAHIWVVFSCKSAEGPSRRFGYSSFVEERGSSGDASRADEPISWRPIKTNPRRLAIVCFQGNQYVILLLTVLCRAIAFQQTVLPPSRALMRSAIARKSLKMTDFSKTGSTNMAETRAINFLTLVSYSNSIVIGGLRRLLLPVLMWAGVDLEYFRAETAWCRFQVFFPTLIAHGSKTRRVRVLIFGDVGEYQTYSN